MLSKINIAPSIVITSAATKDTTRKHFPNWFRFPEVTWESIDRFADVTKYFALGIISFELFFIFRDVFREVYNDLRDEIRFDEGDDDILYGSGSNIKSGFLFGNNRKALSKNNVRKIITWLQQESEVRDRQPPSIKPTFILSLAQELHKCEALNLGEVQRILVQLTKEEAALLESCLLLSKNKTTFQEIGGLWGVKSTITHWIMSSFSVSSPENENGHEHELEPSPYEKLVVKGKNNRHGAILYGPPGTGKTLLIRAIATHSGLPTLVITPSLIQNKEYAGPSTLKLKTLFELITKLKSCVVVLDDFDGLFMNRQDGEHHTTREMKTEWLQWLDGVMPGTGSEMENRVLIVAATNHPWDVDIAATRRLPQKIYVGLPNTEDRLDLLKKWFEDLSPEESILHYIVNATEGYTPTDIYQVLTTACNNGPIIRRDTNLTLEDIRLALSEVSPTRFSVQYIHQLQTFLSSHKSQQSPVSSHHVNPSQYSENGYCWHTLLGDFYEFQIPIDSQALDAITTIFLNSYEWGSSYELELSDDDEFFDEEDD
jgi:ATP-dependent 26S proteasome regulatory subunit